MSHLTLSGLIFYQLCYGKSKASLFCELGIPKVTRHSWMNEECRLCLLLYSMRRKKCGLREVCYVKKCLYMWHVEKGSERVPINWVILKAQADCFVEMMYLKLPKGGFGDERFDVECARLTLKVNVSCDSAAAEQFPETQHEVIEDLEYTDDQLYSCGETAYTVGCFQTNC